MNQNNTKILIEDFPGLYRQYWKTPKETCMYWGFECGDGWRELIYKLSQDLLKVTNKIEAVQVKEKFGGLRFYWEVTDNSLTDSQLNQINMLVEKAEEESLHICEICGSKNNIMQTTGWIRTLCKECSKNNNMQHKLQPIRKIHGMVR